VISLQTADFNDAIENLHKFYDNAMLTSIDPKAPIIHHVNSTTNTKAMIEKQSLPGNLSMLPHALFDHALSHFRYGHFENALQVLLIKGSNLK
jgi:hypothetical protein